MSTAEAPPRSMPFVPSSDLFRLSVRQYHRMLEAGILKEADRCELLNGCIVARKPINPPHAYVLGRLFRRFNAILTEEWLLNPQLPITLEIVDSEPLPDLAIVRGPDILYKGRHPGPKDSELVIEVADSSLVRDQTLKMAIYAAAKVSQYWIVNLLDRRIEVYTRPRGGKSPKYLARSDYPAGSTVPVVLAGREQGSIAVSVLLP